MKKIVSLLKATMTSGMGLFKIKTNNKKRNSILPYVIAGYLMFMIWGSANAFYEKLTPMNLQYILLPIYVLSISIMTFMEGIYKSGPLIFACKDDNLLFSLPLKKRTILWIRVLKFYIFELMFNSLFMLPPMIAYIRWADHLSWTYFLSSIIMLILLPIIPIVLSCFVGSIITGLSSRFKHKNMAQTILSIGFIMIVLLVSYRSDQVFNYIIQNAKSINDLILRIYYPAGVYAKLISDFHMIDLIGFILINVIIITIGIYILSLYYFKLNTNIKKVVTDKNQKNKYMKTKVRTQTASLIKKEINTFLQTPVFIINSGFALVLYCVIVITICIKFDSILPILTNQEDGLGLSMKVIQNNIPILVFGLLSITAFMTSITNSVISLEGKNITILKSLPVEEKTILLSKIYACMLITTPIMVIGNGILLIHFKIHMIESILLLLLSVLIPLVSHFIGIIVNLRFPRLDFENEAEVVKQSVSSFVSVMVGMILAVTTVFILVKIIGNINQIIILLIATILYIIIDTVLYIYLIKKGTKEFKKLSI